MASETTKELRKQATELLKQAENSERLDAINEQMDDAALYLASFKSALVRNGFSEEEASELLKLTIMAGGKK